MLLEDVEGSRNLEICIHSYRSEIWHVGQHPPVKFQSSMIFEAHNLMISSLTRGGGGWVGGWVGYLCCDV